MEVEAGMPLCRLLILGRRRMPARVVRMAAEVPVDVEVEGRAMRVAGAEAEAEAEAEVEAVAETEAEAELVLVLETALALAAAWSLGAMESRDAGNWVSLKSEEADSRLLWRSSKLTEGKKSKEPGPRSLSPGSLSS